MQKHAVVLPHLRQTYIITRHIIGSDHVVVTTVQWTVVSESPSSYVAKACSKLACDFERRISTGIYFFCISLQN